MGFDPAPFCAAPMPNQKRDEEDEDGDEEPPVVREPDE
jgi:hypothetical protein